MSNTILIAIALPHLNLLSNHALIARDIGAGLARETYKSLHVLCIYDDSYDGTDQAGLPSATAAGRLEVQLQQFDAVLNQQIDAFIMPLVTAGIPTSIMLRIGNPHEAIVTVADEIKADLLIVGTHRETSPFEKPSCGTIWQTSQQVSCPILLVCPTTRMNGISRNKMRRAEKDNKRIPELRSPVKSCLFWV